jgi:RimJ/RimL family protein N-acetyltransferase
VTSFADKPTLLGRRVVLRPVVADDAPSMFTDLADAEAIRLTGTHQTFTLEQIQQWCATRCMQEDRLDLAIIDRGTNAWAGEVVINDWDADNRSCGFRIALGPAARNRGLGSEATALVLDHVFDAIDDPPVNRVSLEVFDFNRRAFTVYERAGFRREGTLRQALRWDDEYHDAIVMSVVRSDRDG